MAQPTILEPLQLPASLPRSPDADILGQVHAVPMTGREALSTSPPAPAFPSVSALVGRVKLDARGEVQGWTHPGLGGKLPACGLGGQLLLRITAPLCVGKTGSLTQGTADTGPRKAAKSTGGVEGAQT